MESREKCGGLVGSFSIPYGQTRPFYPGIDDIDTYDLTQEMVSNLGDAFGLAAKKTLGLNADEQAKFIALARDFGARLYAQKDAYEAKYHHQMPQSGDVASLTDPIFNNVPVVVLQTVLNAVTLGMQGRLQGLFWTKETKEGADRATAAHPTATGITDLVVNLLPQLVLGGMGEPALGGRAAGIADREAAGIAEREAAAAAEAADDLKLGLRGAASKTLRAADEAADAAGPSAREAAAEAGVGVPRLPTKPGTVSVTDAVTERPGLPTRIGTPETGAAEPHLPMRPGEASTADMAEAGPRLPRRAGAAGTGMTEARPLTRPGAMGTGDLAVEEPQLPTRQGGAGIVGEKAEPQAGESHTGGENNVIKQPMGFATAGNGSKIIRIKNLDDFFDNPQMFGYATPDQFYKFFKDSRFDPQPLGHGHYAGLPFDRGGGFKINWGGDRILQYHPAGLGHHGGAAYWKISSGLTGTLRFDLNGNLLP